MKLAVIGGGGVRSMFLAKSLAQAAARLKIDELRFMDNSPVKLGIYGKMARKVAAMNDPDVKFLLTGDAEEAVSGADYVITTIRAGGDEMRVRDERAALDAGVIGQETVGAAGLSFAMRSIPELLKYCEAVRKYAKPGAKVFNFTNPAGLVAQALRDAGYDFTFGICDAPSGMLGEFAKLYGVSADAVSGEMYGLNHCSFFRNVYVNGRDVVKELAVSDEAYVKTDLRYFDKATVAAAEGIPNEYLYYYYYPERAYKNIVSGKETRGELIARVNKAMTEELSLIDVEKDFDKALAVYGRYYGERERMYMANETGIARGIPWSFDPMSRDEGGYAGVALRYIEIISTGRPQTMILCVPADGAVPFAEKGDVVEITADITADAVIPHRFDEIPEVNLKLLRRVKEYERRAARGILSRNKSEIIEALKCNPLVASDTISRQLADTYIEYDKEFGGVWED